MKVETAMRLVTRVGVVVSLAFAILAMHGSTPPMRAIAPAVDIIAMPGLMMHESHSMPDINVHGAGALCLWAIVGGVLVAMGRAYSARPRRMNNAAGVHGAAPGSWASHAGLRPAGPDPPFLLCTLRR